MAKKKSTGNQTVTEFMVGRYGYDKFSKFLIVLAMLLLVGTVIMQSWLDMWAQSKYLYIVALAVLFFGYYRMGSKNIKKRKRENEIYMSIIAKFSRKARMQLEREEQVKKYADFEVYQELADDDETVIQCYRCRQCGYTVKKPKDSGVVKIECPECGKSFIDRT